MILPFFVPSAKRKSSKLTFMKDSNNSVIYKSDFLPDMITFMSTYNMTENSTLLFNTSDTFTIASRWTITTTGNFNLTIKADTGKTPIIDINMSDGTVLQSGINNLTVDGLTLKNANASDGSGCIIRADGTTNNTFKNMNLIGGFCAVRATTGVTNLTLDTITIDQCTNGAFRLGDGSAVATYDVTNTIIKNITFLDTLNGGNVQGTIPCNLYMLPKKHNGLSITNVNCGPFGIGTIETSNNVLVQNCIANNFGHGVNTQGFYTTGCSNIEINGNNIKSNADGVSKVIYTSQGDTGLKLKNNQFIISNIGQDGSVFIQNASQILEISGNTFTGTNNSGQCIQFIFNPGSTLANDYQSEHDNIFQFLDVPVGGTLMTFQNLAELNSGGYQKIETVFGYTFAQYQSNLSRGQNSSFINS